MPSLVDASDGSAEDADACRACGLEAAYCGGAGLAFACGQCRAVRYCSPECRDWDWNRSCAGGHRADCIRRAPPPPEPRQTDNAVVSGEEADRIIALREEEADEEENICDCNEEDSERGGTATALRLPQALLVPRERAHLVTEATFAGIAPALGANESRPPQDGAVGSDLDEVEPCEGESSQASINMEDVFLPCEAESTSRAGTSSRRSASRSSMIRSSSSDYNSRGSSNVTEKRALGWASSDGIAPLSQHQQAEPATIASRRPTEAFESPATEKGSNTCYTEDESSGVPATMSEHPQLDETPDIVDEESLLHVVDGVLEISDDEPDTDQALKAIKEDEEHPDDVPEMEGSWRGRDPFVLKQQQQQPPLELPDTVIEGLHESFTTSNGSSHESNALPMRVQSVQPQPLRALHNQLPSKSNDDRGSGSADSGNRSRSSHDVAREKKVYDTSLTNYDESTSNFGNFFGDDDKDEIGRLHDCSNMRSMEGLLGEADDGTNRTQDTELLAAVPSTTLGEIDDHSIETCGGGSEEMPFFTRFDDRVEVTSLKNTVHDSTDNVLSIFSNRRHPWSPKTANTSSNWKKFKSSQFAQSSSKVGHEKTSAAAGTSDDTGSDSKALLLIAGDTVLRRAGVEIEQKPNLSDSGDIRPSRAQRSPVVVRISTYTREIDPYRTSAGFCMIPSLSSTDSSSSGDSSAQFGELAIIPVSYSGPTVFSMPSNQERPQILNEKILVHEATECSNKLSSSDSSLFSKNLTHDIHAPQPKESPVRRRTTNDTDQDSLDEVCDIAVTSDVISAAVMRLTGASQRSIEAFVSMSNDHARSKDGSESAAVIGQKYPSDKSKFLDVSGRGSTMAQLEHTLTAQSSFISRSEPSGCQNARDASKDCVCYSKVVEEVSMNKNTAATRKIKLIRRGCVCYCLLALVLVILPISIGLAVGLGGGAEVSGAVAPTLSPTAAVSTFSAQELSLFKLILPFVADGGASMAQTDSPQNKALIWQARASNFDSLNDVVKIQRYALATFFYSTGGELWTDNSLWLSDESECLWFSRSNLPCDSAGSYIDLSLGFNQVGEVIPAEIGLLTTLRAVSLSGGTAIAITGTLPNSIGALTALTSLSLRANAMTGSLPQSLAELTSLMFLDLSLNSFSASLGNKLAPLNVLQELDLSMNGFTGSIPDLSGVSQLQRLILSANSFTGRLSDSVGKIKGLRELNISHNLLTALPDTLGQIQSLSLLSAEGNQMSGPLNTALGSLVNLRTLALSRNSFSGSIPSQIGQLSGLHHLDLSSNKFSGRIPDELGNLGDLINLQLQANSLSGPIPPNLSKLMRLSLIRIDSNELTGLVPQQVCDVFASNLPVFYLDCGGNVPEVACPAGPCCTYCCNSQNGSSSCGCIYENSGFDFLC